jgi:hypothetical protein
MPAPIRTLVTTRGDHVVTNLTDAQAIARLSAVYGSALLGPYGTGLVDYHNRHGRLTERQIPYCHKIALRLPRPHYESELTPLPSAAPVTPPAPQIRTLYEVPTVTPPVEPVTIPGIDLSAVFAMLRRAATHLQSPAIIVGNLKFSVRRQGGMGVYTSRGSWLGNTDEAGMFVPNPRFVSETLAAEIRTFAADPVGVTARAGRTTGRCCYCRRPLSDDRSTAVGYGPICASRFGLPWGGAPARVPQVAGGADVLRPARPYRPRLTVPTSAGGERVAAVANPNWEEGW